jgi:hypothetical protein
MQNYWAIGVLLVLCSNPTGADDKTQGAATAKADANTQSVATIGTGTFSCQKFIQFDAAPNNSGQMGLIVQWAWGFISAYNLRAAFSASFQQDEAPNPVSPPNSAATLLFMRNFCQKNPQSNLTSATLELIGTSGGIVTSSVNLPQ